MLKRGLLAHSTGICISIYACSSENHFIKAAVKCEQCFVILCVTCGKESVKIYQKLRKGYGDNTISGVMV